MLATPADLKTRRRVATTTRRSSDPQVETSPFSNFLVFAKTAGDDAARDTALQRFQAQVSNAERFLGLHGADSGPFLFGQEMSLAEAAIAPFARRRRGILVATMPPLRVSRRFTDAAAGRADRAVPQGVRRRADSPRRGVAATPRQGRG